MFRTSPSPLLQMIRRVFIDPGLRDRPDRELLDRFRAEQDESAFTALLHRHGPMVLDVCRSVLANDADAEDAFQATFLVLAANGQSIRKAGSLSSWLHGVAYRAAHKALARALRQRKVERLAPAALMAVDDLTWREVRHLVHEELNHLPERLRSPLVLCYLQGLTQDQAASELGLPKGTLKGRLERGRELLRAALVRRGLGPAAVVTAAAWPTAAESCSLPPVLLEATLRAFFGKEGSIAAPVLALGQGVINAMFLSKLKVVIACLIVVGLLGVIAVAVAMQTPAETGQAQSGNNGQQPPGKAAEGKVDLWVKSKDGVLALQFAVKKNRLEPGEALEFLATLKNISDKPVHVFRPFGIAYLAMLNGIQIQGPRGKLKYSGPTPEFVVSAGAFRTLAPGQSVQDTLTVEQITYRGLETPGKYEIALEYHYDGTWDYVAKQAKLPTDIWRGKIQSRSVVVEIGPKADGLKPQPDPLDNDTINAGLDSRDPRILALVAYLDKNGFKLVKTESGHWEVVGHTDGKIIVSIRSFPARVTEEQMKRAVKEVNLAYELNAGAYLAMSYFGLEDSKKGFTAEVNVKQAKLLDLFHKFKPPPEKPPKVGSKQEALQAFRTQAEPVVRQKILQEARDYWLGLLNDDKKWHVQRQPFVTGFERIKDTLSEKEKTYSILHGQIPDLDRPGECWAVELVGTFGNGLAGYIDPADGRLVLLWLIPEG